MILTNPIARTRALYRWEADDLGHRDSPYPKFCAPTEGREIIRRIWQHKWGRNHIPPMPVLEFRPIKRHAYCQGWSRIVLTHDDSTQLVLLHELAHAMRGGSVRNPHTVWFVRRYIALMHFWFNWDREELEFQAMCRGLI